MFLCIYSIPVSRVPISSVGVKGEDGSGQMSVQEVSESTTRALSWQSLVFIPALDLVLAK